VALRRPSISAKGVAHRLADDDDDAIGSVSDRGDGA